MNLLKISDKYIDFVNFMDQFDGEIDPETLKNTLDGINGELEEKIVNIAHIIKNIDYDIVAVEKLEADIRDKKNKLERKKIKMSEYIKSQMMRCDLKEIKSPIFNVKIVENPEKLEVTDENLIPRDFFKSIQTCKLSILDLKKHIKLFGNTPGAFLTRDTRVVIK